MDGIGQNILREIREDGGFINDAPSVKELLEQIDKKLKKKKRKIKPIK